MGKRLFWSLGCVLALGCGTASGGSKTPPDSARRVLHDLLYRPTDLSYRARRRVDRMWVYLGTYTGGSSRGIYLAELNLKQGKLGPPLLAAESENPSFLALHPDGKGLYAVNETASGEVSAFTLDRKTGRLTFINKQPSRGGSPCHIVTDPGGKFVLVANYTGGSVATLPILKEGGLGPAAGFVQHAGSGVNPRRQEAPHAHSINLDRKARIAVAADLGLDRLLLYRFDRKTGALDPNEPPHESVAPGSGPRHFAFHPSGKAAYVINEMLLTVTAFRYDERLGALKEIQTVSTLPPGVTNPGGYSTAEVQVHPRGAYLYGSNRGHNTLARFAVAPADGRLTLLGHTSTGGRTPRNFGIDPTGQYLIAANQDSDTLQLFKIDKKTGDLTPSGGPVPCPRPVCVKFLPR